MSPLPQPVLRASTGNRSRTTNFSPIASVIVLQVYSDSARSSAGTPGTPAPSHTSVLCPVSAPRQFLNQRHGRARFASAKRRTGVRQRLTHPKEAALRQTTCQTSPDDSQRLDALKKRRQRFDEFGVPMAQSPCWAAARPAPDDYLRCLDNIRQLAETAHQFKVKVVAGLVRSSRSLASLPAVLRLPCQADHPNFGGLFDYDNLRPGPGKLE